MVWNAAKLTQESPPISPLVNGFPAPSMSHSAYQFPQPNDPLKSPLLPGISLSGVGTRPHFQTGLMTSSYHISGSPVGYGPPTYSNSSVIQPPNSNLKVPITPSEQGSAFIVPKIEPSRSPNNSPHL